MTTFQLIASKSCPQQFFALTHIVTMTVQAQIVQQDQDVNAS